MSRVAADRCRRSGDLHPGELGRARKERLGGDADPRRNSPAQVIALGGYRIECRAGAKVDDDDRTAVHAVRGGRVHDAIGADRFGVIVAHAHSGAHAGIHHQRFAVQVGPAHIDPLAGQRRNDRGDRGSVHVRGAPPGHLQKPQHLQRELIWHAIVVGRQPPARS